MYGTVVGVLRGGPSSEHELSLSTGTAILRNLPEDRYTARDIFIDRSGRWYERGRPVEPAQVLRSMDAVIVGLHGAYGEDGEVQKLLERFGVPYTGSDSFGSYIATHRALAKEKARETGLKTPKYHLIETHEDLDRVVGEVVRTFLQPVVVKPVATNSSVGVTFAHGHAPLRDAARAVLDSGSGALIEERVRGRRATIGVVEGLRGEELYVLPPVEIVNQGEEERMICPAPFPKEVTKELIEAARSMHRALGLKHYSRSEFLVSPRAVYYLRTDALPDLHDSSDMRVSLDAVGVQFGHLLEHLVDLTLKR